MTSLIKKAVFPVAGFGTRLLPVTKSIPKEMLPIVDTPIIQFAVEEAIAAGITEAIFITTANKSAIEYYFDSNFQLESFLLERHHNTLLAHIKHVLPLNITCAFIHQPQPFGLGHAVLCAKSLIGDQPFAVILADDLIKEAPHGCLKNMVSIYEKTAGSIIAVESVPKTEVSKYGIVDVGEKQDGYAPIKSLIEKPELKDAPSDLAVVGRYILSPRIFSILEHTNADLRGEVQLTDAIAKLIRDEQVYSYFLQGKRYDCGSKYGYLKANVDFALTHPELKEEFKQYLASLITNI